MARTWTVQEIGDLTRGFQQAAVICAAAELDVFNALAAAPLTASELAKKVGGDLRATTILADALAAMDLLVKTDGRYSLADGLAGILTDAAPQKMLAMTRHQSCMMRRWAQLARVVKSGQCWPKEPSTRGAAADTESFIEAMDEIAHRSAPPLINSLGEMKFSCVLDVGGASGTYTLAFLRKFPSARAILLDLPDVIPLARQRLTAAGLADRVRLVAGDMLTDALPSGADLVWISAIIHMLSREQCRLLYRKSFDALPQGGQVLIRDLVMRDDHIEPKAGALFAVNMLTGTQGGGTYSLAEIREDLESAGFKDVRQLKQDAWMDSLVAATK